MYVYILHGNNRTCDCYCGIFSPVRRLYGSIYTEMSGPNPSLFHHLSYVRGCEHFMSIDTIGKFNKDAHWVLKQKARHSKLSYYDKIRYDTGSRVVRLRQNIAYLTHLPSSSLVTVRSLVTAT